MREREGRGRGWECRAACRNKAKLRVAGRDGTRGLGTYRYARECLRCERIFFFFTLDKRKVWGERGVLF